MGFSTCKQSQVQLIEEQVVKCAGMKTILEEELRAINCAQLQADGRPRDGVLPKSGSLENFRSLHHPRQEAISILRAVLVLLGEDEATLDGWEPVRSHLVFRDERNPWRNLHDRLERFVIDPTQHLGRLDRAIAILRETGGEEVARKVSAMSIHLFRWVTLQGTICNLRVRQQKLRQSCDRTHLRPFPPPPEEEVAEAEQ